MPQRIGRGESGPGVQFQFPVSDTAAGYELFLEESTTLEPGDWSEVPFGEMEAVRFHEGVLEWRREWNPGGDPDRRFFRLGVP